MTKKIQGPAILSRLLKDRLGNFAMVTAVTIPVILAAGGVAIDMTKMVLAKAELQDASDAAALAAASALANDNKTAAEAKKIAAELFALQMSGTSGIVKEGDKTLVDDAPVIDIKETAIQNNGKSYTVDIATSYSVKFSVFTRLLGHSTIKLAAASTAESVSATESKNAFSMFLVLDRSGSMSFITTEIESKDNPCQNFTSSNWNEQTNLKKSKPCYVPKINALKRAVGTLATQMNKADPNAQYVRMGASSYNDIIWPQISALAWGTKSVVDYVNAIPRMPTGGTDSSDAFAEAVKRLKDASELTAHQTKNGKTPNRYIVFMTDGENTHYRKQASDTEADRHTKISCDEARTANIEVYAVAFLAPARGQKLLKYCATTEQHYFAAENVESLVSAFSVIGSQTAAVVSRLTK
ncbi:VWA domain-containing protein [Shinella sp. H4-D48]|uniref:VWA domain-containing protein n=1 Tax=Shinella sedimenti TaxID=2919913 RepID=A0ABT0CPE8_9HYPH|nr:MULTISPECIES: VWA domain-containing protein [Shinella]MCJ8150502.1 VWA domain-containing protein [Shinella sedimenti]UNK38730.1 VWA domain-containing protein [Shinella sp. H4-D48]